MSLSPDTRSVDLGFQSGGCLKDRAITVVNCEFGIAAAGALVSFDMHVHGKGNRGML